MQLIKNQDGFLELTEKIMNEFKFIEKEDYSVFIIQEIDFRTGNTTNIMKVQFEKNDEIVKSLYKIGWKRDHKFYSNNHRLISDESKDYFDEDIEMIQLTYK